MGDILQDIPRSSAGVVWCGRSRAMARSETGWMVCNALVATVLLLSLAHAAHFPPQVMRLGDALEVSDPYAEAFLGETPLGEEEEPSATDTTTKSTDQETSSQTDAATKSTDEETSATDTATKSTKEETSATDTATKSTDEETSGQTDAATKSTEQKTSTTDTATKSTDAAAAKSDAADPQNEAEPSTPEQKKLASEQAQVKDAELEWKDAWDSTEAPGKLKLTITPLPNSEDHTWLKQMVENQKPQLLQQDLVTAEDAMKSAEKMMKKRPSEDKLSTAEVLAADLTRVNQVAKVASSSTNSTASIDAVVAAATTKDPQVVAAELELATTKEELSAADDDVASAKERVMNEAATEKERLQEEFKTHQQSLKTSKLQKEKAIKEAAQAIAAEKVGGGKSE